MQVILLLEVARGFYKWYGLKFFETSDNLQRAQEPSERAEAIGQQTHTRGKPAAKVLIF